MSRLKFLKENKGLFIAIVLVISALILEQIFRDDLFNASLKYIVTLQTKLPAFTKYIFHIASGCADPDIILPVFLFVMALQVNKFFLVKLGLYISFIGYFLSVIKTIYGNPRPYWLRPYEDQDGNSISNGIKPFEKYAEYGNPSGHAFFSVALYGYLFYLMTVNHRKKVEARRNHLMQPLRDEESNGNTVEVKNVNLPAEQAAGFTCKETLLTYFSYIF